MRLAEPTIDTTAEAREMAKQAEVELAILLSLERSLLIALEWTTHDRAISYKLSTLRFAATSLARHLERTRILADFGGYLHLITDAHPHLAAEVKELRDVRGTLQAGFERTMFQLEYVPSADVASFDHVCSQLEQHLTDLRALGQKETELLQHSFVQEEGGSG